MRKLTEGSQLRSPEIERKSNVLSQTWICLINIDKVECEHSLPLQNIKTNFSCPDARIKALLPLHTTRIGRPESKIRLELGAIVCTNIDI